MSPKLKKTINSSGLKKINKTGKKIKKRVPYPKLLVFSVSINLLVILFLLIFTKNIPPEVPLFYGLPEGEAQLAPKSSLILPSLLSLIVILLNTSIAFYTRDEFIKKILVVSGSTITFLSAVTTLKIVTLVGSF